jgi:hypothetical protein
MCVRSGSIAGGGAWPWCCSAESDSGSATQLSCCQEQMQGNRAAARGRRALDTWEGAGALAARPRRSCAGGRGQAVQWPSGGANLRQIANSLD